MQAAAARLSAARNDNASNDNSSWKRAIREARRAAFAALTPDQRAEYAADKQARADAGKVKREAKRKARLAIGAMVIAGDTLDEISAATGRTIPSLWHLRLYHGLPIAVRKGCRRLFCWLPDLLVGELDAIAIDMEMDRAQCHAAIMRANLIDGGLVARRTLGIKRRAAAG